MCLPTYRDSGPLIRDSSILAIQASSIPFAFVFDTTLFDDDGVCQRENKVEPKLFEVLTRLLFPARQIA